MMEYAIEAQKISFKYLRSTQPALSQVDYVQNIGEAVGICGRSGAGKSSLLFCLNRIIPEFFAGEFSGKVRILGEDISGLRTYQLAEKVGIVLQDFESQLFCSRAELDIAFGPENLGISREEISKRIESALETVGIKKLRKRAPETLSGGEKQRLAIASVLALEPQILIFDEATTDLDPVGKEQIWELVEKFKEQNKTIIIVEHEPEALFNMNRIVILEKGEVVAEGGRDEILSQPFLLKKYGVKPPQISELFYHLGIPYKPMDTAQASKILKEQGFCVDDEKAKEILSQEEKIKPNSALFEISSLYHTYPNQVNALKGIDLEIYEGDFLAIVGQNGSGKTTLVKHLNGLFLPTKGQVKYKGREIKKGDITWLSQKIGFVFQNPDHQIFSSRVYDEVAFAPRNYGFTEQEINRQVEWALDLVGLTGKEDANPFLLTKGERQRLAIASVLSADPEVLILDEPTTGLDYQEQVRVMELLKRLNQEGRTIIIITHTIWLVAEYAKRAVVMAEGEIITDGAPREIFVKSDVMERADLKPPEITELGIKMGFAFLSVDEAQKILKQRNK